MWNTITYALLGLGLVLLVFGKAISPGKAKALQMFGVLAAIGSAIMMLLVYLNPNLTSDAEGQAQKLQFAQGEKIGSLIKGHTGSELLLLVLDAKSEDTKALLKGLEKGGILASEIKTVEYIANAAEAGRLGPGGLKDEEVMATLEQYPNASMIISTRTLSATLRNLLLERPAMPKLVLVGTPDQNEKAYFSEGLTFLLLRSKNNTSSEDKVKGSTDEIIAQYYDVITAENAGSLLP